MAGDTNKAIQHPTIHVDPDHVPAELQRLIPYAEKWGIEDHELLVRLLDEAPSSELEELNNAVQRHLKQLYYELLRPPPWDKPEMRIFSALLWAKRFAWLKMIGWPDHYPPRRMNTDLVPPSLHPLIPYAEKWSIFDDELQEKLMRDVPIEEIEAMYATLHPLMGEILDFILAHRDSNDSASYEVMLLGMLRHSNAGRVLSEVMPERYLQIVNWPDDFPPFSFDTARVPAILQRLEPYIKKWVRHDSLVRGLALHVATTAELEDFVGVAEQIGRKRISQMGLDLIDGEVAKEEGYTLLYMLDMVDKAEWELKKRGKSPAADETVSE